MTSSKKLFDVWRQAPPDYYDRGVKSNIFQYIWHTNKIRVFKKNVPRKDFSKILDIGCASGLMTSKIAAFFPKSKVTGIDVYSDAISLAQKKYPHIRFYTCDAHKLPFPANTFDLIISYEMIEHVLDPKKVLKEMYRVAKKDSTIIISMDSGSLLFRLIWWFWEKTTGRVWKGAHLHPFHHSELEETIKNAGFKIKQKHFSHLGMEVTLVLQR